MIRRITADHNADRYCKRFTTYEHLVTMLYATFNHCNSLREVTTGMLAAEQRLNHLGVRYHPRRSTISDANRRRQADVFGAIYYKLYQKYAGFLSDSRKKSIASRCPTGALRIARAYHRIPMLGRLPAQVLARLWRKKK
jgi:hypothetical protein